jgi:methyltransferase (TIGR00027 family)
MQDGPSWSAYSVALLRAQHQVVEGGSIFPDPLAVRITGESADTIARGAREHPQSALRQFVVVRSRFAEDSLADAVDRGVRQVVLLGAGLDTFGLRNPHAGKGVRVFEVDRLATQRLKRRFLDKANLAVPPALTFVAADFERESFLRRLSLAGFSTQDPAFFIWLGVVVYLSRKAVSAALSAIAMLPDAEVVFDYGEPPASIAEPHRTRYKAIIARAKASGEPWLSVFTPAEMAAGLAKLGFSEVEDLGPDAVAARYFREELAGGGGHIVRARKAGQQALLNVVSSAG